MEATERLGLPMLFVGQAAKEITHNEALVALDTLVGAAVEEGPRNAPPASPAIGACYVIGTTPSGVWAGKALHLAAYTAGGWRFTAPVEGLSALVKSSGLTAVYRNGGWESGMVRAAAILVDGEQVVGPQAGAIANPTGGAQVDSETRTAVVAILAALRQHGLIAS